MLSMGIENDIALVQVIKLLGLIVVFLVIIILANVSPVKEKRDSEKIKGDVPTNDTDSR
ncbi:hypothetical protein KA062_01350 [Patescibacteria group bacterium]|nr:hypothetical protein [Patescibacteria group bacterium]